MKLINKDKALKVLKFNSWNIDEWECSTELRQAGLQANDMDYQSINELPTVEAMPIEYLFKELKQCKASTLVEVGAIIDKWVKENETN